MNTIRHCVPNVMMPICLKVWPSKVLALTSLRPSCLNSSRPLFSNQVVFSNPPSRGVSHPALPGQLFLCVLHALDFRLKSLASNWGAWAVSKRFERGPLCIDAL